MRAKGLPGAAAKPACGTCALSHELGVIGRLFQHRFHCPYELVIEGLRIFQHREVADPWHRDNFDAEAAHGFYIRGGIFRVDRDQGESRAEGPVLSWTIRA